MSVWFEYNTWIAVSIWFKYNTWIAESVWFEYNTWIAVSVWLDGLVYQQYHKYCLRELEDPPEQKEIFY